MTSLENTVPTSSIVPFETIQSRILVMRGQRVLLDRDLAELYGVTTAQLNQQIKRNPRKFPQDFTFQLTPAERSEVVATHERLQSLKFSRVLPNAFTEHGAIQAANVLSSDRAVKMSVQVVHAFIHLRQLVINHKAISSKLAELDARVGAHDEQLAAIVEAIRELAVPVEPKNSRKIGFYQTNR